MPNITPRLIAGLVFAKGIFFLQIKQLNFYTPFTYRAQQTAPSFTLFILFRLLRLAKIILHLIRLIDLAVHHIVHLADALLVLMCIKIFRFRFEQCHCDIGTMRANPLKICQNIIEGKALF